MRRKARRLLNPSSPSTPGLVKDLREASHAIWQWSSQRRFAGHEPYDLLNSEYIARLGLQATPLAPFLIHLGRRWGGLRLRKWLKVPPSRNPKALALMISALSDLDQCGLAEAEMTADIAFLRSELIRLRSGGESEYAWGYDWYFRSLRGTVLPRFSPNSIATTFAGEAFLDLAARSGDEVALEIARSSARFLFTRLQRSVDTPTQLCLSYTAGDRTQIYNSSALAAAFQARVNSVAGTSEFAEEVVRAMQYLVDAQRDDGSWFYGAGRLQRWVDHFHTGYNLSALWRYRRYTSDHRFDQALQRGYEFYVKHFFTEDMAPKYYSDHKYPLDIHSCTQAILTFCDFWEDDPEAPKRAYRVAEWMLQNMYSPAGTVFYQRHALWIDRTPYMRWGQAWALRALARLASRLQSSAVVVAGEGERACAE